jgi:D-sedoheptulose 7-phosphate isomerase
MKCDMQIENQIKDYLLNLSNTIISLDIEEIEECANILHKAYIEERNIFICGNGGSAATASHFACDINKGVSYGLDKRFKVLALTDNAFTMTAYANDVDYDYIFLEQLKNFYSAGDVLIGISGSGNSSNILKAIDYVNSNEGVTIGWTGFDGGKLKKLSKYSINANVMDMQISEDVHMTLVHILMKVLRKKLTGSEKYL